MPTHPFTHPLIRLICLLSNEFTAFHSLSNHLLVPVIFIKVVVYRWVWLVWVGWLQMGEWHKEKKKKPETNFCFSFVTDHYTHHQCIKQYYTILLASEKMHWNKNTHAFVHLLFAPTVPMQYLLQFLFFLLDGVKRFRLRLWLCIIVMQIFNIFKITLLDSWCSALSLPLPCSSFYFALVWVINDGEKLA